MEWKQIEATVNEFDDRFKQVPEDSEDFDADLVAVPNMDRSQYLNLLEKRATTSYGSIFSEFRGFVVNTVLGWYAGRGLEERETLVQLFATRRAAKNQLWTLVEEYRWRLQKAFPAEKPGLLSDLLRIALLAEEFLVEVAAANLLTSAWGDAEDAGLDPAVFFREAAEAAGKRKLLHGESASEILRSFEPYDYGG